MRAGGQNELCTRPLIAGYRGGYDIVHSDYLSARRQHIGHIGRLGAGRQDVPHVAGGHVLRHGRPSGGLMYDKLLCDGHLRTRDQRVIGDGSQVGGREHVAAGRRRNGRGHYLTGAYLVDHCSRRRCCLERGEVTARPRFLVHLVRADEDETRRRTTKEIILWCSFSITHWTAALTDDTNVNTYNGCSDGWSWQKKKIKNTLQNRFENDSKIRSRRS